MGGVGVDLVDVQRLRTALQRTAGFAELVYSDAERRAVEHQSSRTRRLAAMFAAKEAFLKAIGLGIWRGVPLREIEVEESSTAAARLRLGPCARQALTDRGCSGAELSLSAGRITAIAVVLVH